MNKQDDEELDIPKKKNGSTTHLRSNNKDGLEADSDEELDIPEKSDRLTTFRKTADEDEKQKNSEKETVELNEKEENK